MIPTLVAAAVLVLACSACPAQTAPVSCASLRCPEHAVCVEEHGAARCRCLRGYLGEGCDRCDELLGYHRSADGLSCSADPCDPDPCNSDNNEVCELALCRCDTAGGYHRSSDGATCTAAPCDPDPCNPDNFELCDGGACVCAPGLVRGADGITCSDDPCDPWPCDAANHELCDDGQCACDVALGYHLASDGQTCTADPCDPDPCSASNHELCAQGACLCDAPGGFHLAADGHTCTRDPCDPDPCDNLAQACVGGACESLQADPCDPTLAVPELPAGSGRYLRDGIAVATRTATYRLGYPHDVITGELVLNLMRDVHGALVQDLVAAGSFPICVALDSSDDGTGYAFLEDGGSSFSTTATDCGRLALVAMDGDDLIGRFAFDARQNSGSALTSVRAGAFVATPR